MCELHDIPDFINPEALNQHGNTNPVSNVQTIAKYVERYIKKSSFICFSNPAII